MEFMAILLERPKEPCPRIESIDIHDDGCKINNEIGLLSRFIVVD